MGLARVILGRVSHVAKLGLAVDRVTVDIDLGIQAVQVAVGLDHQRVHLKQRQIVVLEKLGKADEDMDELLDLIALQTQLECQLARLEGLSPH